MIVASTKISSIPLSSFRVFIEEHSNKKEKKKEWSEEREIYVWFSLTLRL